MAAVTWEISGNGVFASGFSISDVIHSFRMNTDDNFPAGQYEVRQTIVSHDCIYNRYRTTVRVRVMQFDTPEMIRSVIESEMQFAEEITS